MSRDRDVTGYVGGTGCVPSWAFRIYFYRSNFIAEIAVVEVRQSCVLALALFRIVIDWTISICADKAGVNVGQSLITDIDYADYAVLFAENDVQWTSILESFDTAANTMDLHTFWAKTKIQNVASGPSPPSCVISGHQVEAVNRFT